MHLGRLGAVACVSDAPQWVLLDELLVVVVVVVELLPPAAPPTVPLALPPVVLDVVPRLLTLPLLLRSVPVVVVL